MIRCVKCDYVVKSVVRLLVYVVVCAKMSWCDGEVNEELHNGRNYSTPFPSALQEAGQRLQRKCRFLQDHALDTRVLVLLLPPLWTQPKTTGREKVGNKWSFHFLVLISTTYPDTQIEEFVLSFHHVEFWMQTKWSGSYKSVTGLLCLNILETLLLLQLTICMST